MALPGKRSKILSILFLYLPMAFLTLFILMNFYLGVNKVVTRNPAPRVWGFAPLIVLSGSMEPAVSPGDVVVIQARKAEQYKVGDIAAYVAGQTVYTHRIIGKEKSLFILKGDNNNTADEPVRPKQFAGKVLLIIPRIGLAMVFFKKPAGLAFLAFLIFLFIFGEDLQEKAKKLRQQKNGKRGGEQ